MTSKLILFLLVTAPFYLWFLKTLQRLSRQKSKPFAAVQGVLHRADTRG